jgi:hypothetical protein
MGAPTKSLTTALSAVTTTQVSSAVDVSGQDLSDVLVQIVQVGTATTASSFQVQWSLDGTLYFSTPAYSTDKAAGTYSFTIAVPDSAQWVKISFVQQAGGTSSTCTAQVGKSVK